MDSVQGRPPGYLEQYRGHRLVAIATAFLVVDVVFTGLRFYARRLHRQKLRWEDWILIPSLLFALGCITIAFLSINYGAVGRHIEYAAMYPDKIVFLYKIGMMALPPIYIVSMSLPKLSILGLYLHILRDRPSRLIAYGTMGAIIVNCIVMIVLVIYTCNPISYGWKSWIGEKVEGAWCVDFHPRFVWATFANIVTDVIMMGLPINLIWRIQMSKTNKFGLYVVFALGSVGVVASCMRFAAFTKTEAITDVTWTAVELVGWCIAEPGVYTMAACVLAFRPLVTKLMEVVSPVVSRFTWWKIDDDVRSIEQGDLAEKQVGLERTLAHKQNFVLSKLTVGERAFDSLNEEYLAEFGHSPKNVIYVERTYDVKSHDIESDQ